jgi:hypothetical protein
MSAAVRRLGSKDSGLFMVVSLVARPVPSPGDMVAAAATLFNTTVY